jgi:hypothetical protein
VVSGGRLAAVPGADELRRGREPEDCLCCGRCYERFSYAATTKRQSAGGYISSFYEGGLESLAMQGSQAGALKWSEDLTLHLDERIMLKSPLGSLTGGALFWGKAGILYAGLKTGWW